MANGTIEIRIGDWIGEGWRMFVEQWQTWVLMSLTIFAILSVPIGGIFVLVFVVMAAVTAAAGGGPPDAAAVLLIYLIVFVVSMFTAVISAYLSCGMYRAAFKQLRGGRIEVRDLFSGGDSFLSALGATILIAIISMIGFMLCIVPGYIVMGLYSFALPLIIERGMRATDAMRTSWEVGRQQMLMITVWTFLVHLIAQAGTYACYIGLLATYPLQFTMMAVAFRDCFGVEGARVFPSSSAKQAASYGAPPQTAPPQPPP